MSQINPFVASILQTPQAQRQQTVDKDRQARRAQDLAKNAALAEDQLEHQVESSEELAPPTKEQKRERGFKRNKHEHAEDEEPEETGDEPHLDLTA